MYISISEPISFVMFLTQGSQCHFMVEFKKMTKNLKVQISLLEGKMGLNGDVTPVPFISKKVKSRVKEGPKKEYLSLQLIMLLKEKLQQKMVS